MELTKEELAINDLRRLNYELKYNNEVLLKNEAVLNITGTDEDDDSILPNGLYNHLFSINSILRMRTRELQDTLIDKMKKIGRPILVHSECPATKNSLQFQILVPEGFTDSTDCRKEIYEAINDTVIPIIEKYITPQKEGE